MNLRLLFRILSFVVVVALVAGSVYVAAVPTETALACNPCDCPEDRRINCQGIQFYGVYTYTRGGVCYIDAYRMQDNGSPGRRAWRVTSRDLADIPERPEENLLITEGDAIAIYRLTSGELQVNAGPAPDGKVYVLIFNNCPAGERRESTFTPGA
ncbi:MAG: hypothetical protein SF123_10070 [Chloroflexota bacterium]|nr:hypothetical protein [Chloroflexota bacterium]